MCNHQNPRPSRRRMLSLMAASTAALGLGVRPRLAQAAATPIDLPKPGPKDTCPVCGMFVAKYPEWVATVLYADGHADHFDGSKDFFKYLHDMEKYAQGRTADQITGMGVTEYYSLKMIEAHGAIYAIGSDVLGPMGHELIPLMNEADASDFLKDHKGKRTLAFDEVKDDLLTRLDNGQTD
ncbi:nitrous oxide reductase accessory protein NosL [Thioclava marina]|jgi:Predicted lipoprotein involved in nitrous oxide reduction|uniref:nitrous oxide reductase accessory protein NosL n=1 Tax=Thioclava marina TaxID=1915077 RepID=UPI002356515C|nr:nitrous oxide reductase accessory protein NosL [Thioclava marina]